MKRGAFFVLCMLLTFLLTVFALSGCDRQAEGRELAPDSGSLMASMSESIPSPGLTALIDPSSEIRGVYIATAANIDYPTKPDLSGTELRRELDTIISECAKVGINTICFQVRTSCDALYDSAIFPVSQYLSSSRKLTIDPLLYLVEQAHKRNIFVYAWVNPLRVTIGGTSNPAHDVSVLPAGSPARKHPDWCVAYPDGKLYFDPGIPSVRELVAEGVEEIVSKYNVDGILFDDYFYPYPVNGADGKTVSFDDSVSFSKYGSGLKIDDFRRNNVNELVKACYTAVKKAAPNVLFGVAPFGIWQNADGSEDGSATSGLQSYSSIYCDAKAWIQGGYIDYLAPQIYWQFDSAVAPYDELVRWWNRELDNTCVKLLVSHAAYRYDEWDSPAGEMKQQVRFARSELTYRGSLFYGYDEIKRNLHGIRDELLDLYGSEIVYTDPLPNGLGVSVSSPATGTYINAANTYLLGSSSPDTALTVNGTKVGRTRSGFFALYVPLSPGKNEFVFKQNDMTYTHVIYRGTASTLAQTTAKMKEFSVIPVSPVKPVMNEGGKTLTVSCTAPVGSTVTARLGETTVTLKQTGTAKAEKDAWVAAVYSGTLTLPKVGDDELKPLGEVIFIASQGKEKAEANGAEVRVRGTKVAVPVRVLHDDTELKLGYDTSYYEDFSVQSAGMTDNALSQANGMYLLRVGGYVYEDSVEELPPSQAVPVASLSKASVVSSSDYTSIRIAVDKNVPHNGTVSGGAFQLTLYNVDVKTVPDSVSIADNPLIEAVTINYPNKANCVRFSCRLFDTKNFYGFTTVYEEGTIVVKFLNPRKIDTAGKNPLAGLTIVVDAGHGGTDVGALGPLRTAASSFNEKDMNLSVVRSAAAELEKLGASVIQTRSDDRTVDLMKRVYDMLGNEPDLFVSIHQNSVGYSTDIRRVRGTVGLWWSDAGMLPAETISNAVAAALGFRHRPTQQQMLAVCRNPKYPSCLIEVSFVTAAEEYEYMLNGGTETAGLAVARGVLDYYNAQQKWLKK